MHDHNSKIVKNDDFKVAIYARVSSDQQAQAGTIASQIEALHERVAKENLKLEQEYRFIDDGYTGAMFLRPALERLRDTAAAGTHLGVPQPSLWMITSRGDVFGSIWDGTSLRTITERFRFQPSKAKTRESLCHLLFTIDY